MTINTKKITGDIVAKIYLFFSLKVKLIFGETLDILVAGIKLASTPTKMPRSQ